MRTGSIPKNRQEKIKFLNDVRDRRISLNDFLEPITGMILVHNGQRWDMKTGKQIDLNTLEKQLNVPAM